MMWRRLSDLKLNTWKKIRHDADSLAGLVLEHTGLLPKANRLLKFPKFSLKIISVNKRRIEKIQFTKHEI